MSAECIVAVALQYDGLVFSMAPPARHANVLWGMHKLGILTDYKIEQLTEQGFLTSLGRYVSREAAVKIAYAAGQMEGRTKTPSEHRLYSEDLW